MAKIISDEYIRKLKAEDSKVITIFQHPNSPNTYINNYDSVELVGSTNGSTDEGAQYYTLKLYVSS